MWKTQGRILVVEEDNNMAEMLRIHFDAQGYEVFVTNRSDSALKICRVRLPKVVLLNIQLPNAEIFVQDLQASLLTRDISILYLVPEHYQDVDKPGFADNHILMPFKVEDLHSYVETTFVRYAQQRPNRHPISNLPTAGLIETQLKMAKEEKETRILLFCRFNQKGSFLQRDEVIVTLADILCETLITEGGKNDFVGQSTDNEFIVITSPELVPKIREQIVRQFNEQLGRDADLSHHQMQL